MQNQGRLEATLLIFLRNEHKRKREKRPLKWLWAPFPSYKAAKKFHVSIVIWRGKKEFVQTKINFISKFGKNSVFMRIKLYIVCTNILLKHLFFKSGYKLQQLSYKSCKITECLKKRKEKFQCYRNWTKNSWTKEHVILVHLLLDSLFSSWVFLSYRWDRLCFGCSWLCSSKHKQKSSHSLYTKG